MRPTSIVTLLAFVALAAPAPAAVVSPAGIRFPQLAVNAKGATIVAWERRANAGFAVEVRTGSGPRRLGPTLRLARQAHSPRVAIGADGTRAVQWLEEDRRGVRTVRVAVARPGHGFGKAQLLYRRRANVVSIGVAVQPNGRVVAIWQRAESRLMYALAPRGRKIGRSQILTSTGTTSEDQITVDPRDGAVVLAYGTPLSSSPPTNQQAAARTLAVTSTSFSEPVVLSNPARLAEAYPTVVAGSGGAGVAYTQSGSAPSLHLARRKADGTWAPPELIASPVYGEDVYAIGLMATLPTEGSALATWSISTEPRRGSTSKQTVASLALPGAAFGAPAALTPANATYGASAVASAGAEAFLATATAHGPLLLATRPAGGGALQTRTVTSDGDGDAVLAAAGSHVLLAYQQGDRLRLHSIR